MAELITAVANLLWPLLVLVVLVQFRGGFQRLLRTAERRELEVEVGGQRLTMHELNDQQNEMIQDLQRQLSALNAQLEHSAHAQQSAPPAPQQSGAQQSGALRPGTHPTPAPAQPGVPASPSYEDSVACGQAPDGGGAAPSNGDGNGHAEPVPAPRPPTGQEPFAVLWVAERPESHALLVGQLRDNGVRVTIARTTSEAMEQVSRRPYRLVVSDMGRREDGRYRPDAGVALLGELRDTGIEVPVVVFGEHRGELQYGAQARHAGAVAVTSSAAELVRHFQNFALL